MSSKREQAKAASNDLRNDTTTGRRCVNRLKYSLPEQMNSTDKMRWRGFPDSKEKDLAAAHYAPSRDFNEDETDRTLVQNKHRKNRILSKHHIGALSAAERGYLMTAAASMSAAGDFIPPLIIFRPKNFNRFFIRGAPSSISSSFLKRLKTGLCILLWQNHRQLSMDTSVTPEA